MDNQIQLLTREDCLRALHNQYIEKYVGACLSVEFYKHRKENPINGDDMQKIDDSLKTAEANIDSAELMLGFIDDFLSSRAKIDKMGGVDEKFVLTK